MEELKEVAINLIIENNRLKNEIKEVNENCSHWLSECAKLTQELKAIKDIEVNEEA